MALLEYQECIALFWTRTGSVYGTRVHVKNHKLSIVETASAESESGNFTTAFSQVSEQLLQPTTNLIIAGGSIAGSVCFDILIPQMSLSDVKQAIQYELPRHMPCDPMEVTYGYRIIEKPEEEGKSKLLIRVYAVLKKDWNELITEFTSSEVKIDVFISPNLVLDPLLEDVNELFIPDIDEDFIHTREDDSPMRQMIQIDEEIDKKSNIPDSTSLLEKLNYESPSVEITESLDHYIAPLILAAYGLSSDFRESHKQMVPMPKEMVPERFRRLKISFFMFLITCVLMIMALGIRSWWDSWTKLQSLKEENQLVNEKLKKLKNTNSRLIYIDELITELQGAEIGNDEIAKSLYLLSKIIPKTMWLSHYSTRGSSMDLSVRAPAGQQSKLVSILNKTGIFKVKNSYTRRNSDGTENIYVHIEFLNVNSGKRDK